MIAPARAILLLLVLFSPDGAWKAGFSRIRITPGSPIPLAGYAGRAKPFEGVAHELFVKALALEDSGGRRGLLLTADHIGRGAEIATPLAEELGPPDRPSRATRSLLNALPHPQRPAAHAHSRSAERRPRRMRPSASSTQRAPEKTVDAA